MNKATVKVGERFIFTKSVEVCDIEECLITGRDIMTFQYKGKIYKSYIFIS